MERLRQAKRPAMALAGPYGHPFHPILITLPIGTWVASFIFDIGSHIRDADALALGSRWLIAIGLLGAAAAALVGALDLFTIPTGTRAFRTGLLHMGLNLTLIVAYLVNFLIRLGDDGPVGAGLIVLSALSLAVLSISGALGGRLAYHYGVRVADEQTQADGYHTTTDKD